MPNLKNNLDKLPDSSAIAERTAKMQWQKNELVKNINTAKLEREKHEKYIKLADGVTAALDVLSTRLFADVLDIVQQKLTTALTEILEQPIKFCAESDISHGTACVKFWVERDGNKEDVIRGQGGSVANILSVGLRMLAIATLDPKKHRRFLVLDEQDCWLRPELVPLLVKIIHEASTALGLQTLVISHHNLATFEAYADNIIALERTTDGELSIRKISPKPIDDDAEESNREK